MIRLATVAVQLALLGTLAALTPALRAAVRDLTHREDQP